MLVTNVAGHNLRWEDAGQGVTRDNFVEISRDEVTVIDLREELAVSDADKHLVGVARAWKLSVGNIHVEQTDANEEHVDLQTDVAWHEPVEHDRGDDEHTTALPLQELSE